MTAPVSDGNRRRRNVRAAWMLGLLALALYGPGIGWGLPHATSADRVKTFATDEILPLEGLAEMHSTFVAASPDRNYGYPWLHYLVVSAAQAPYMGWLWVSGQVEQVSPEYPYGLDDPVVALRGLTRVGRAVSVLMAAGVVVATFLLGSLLCDTTAGIVAALLTLLSELLAYYSGTGNLDAPAASWSVLGVLLFAFVLERGMTPGRMAGLGALAALAMATKDQAVVIFLPLGLALLLPTLGRAQPPATRLRSLAVGLGMSIAVYVLATGMVVDPMRHVIHVRRLLFDPESVGAGAVYHAPAQGVAELLLLWLEGLLLTLTPPATLAALAGFALTLRERPRHMVLLLPFAALFVLLLLPTGYAPRRYVLPLLPLLDVFAACALVRLARPLGRLAWTLLLVVVLGFRLGGFVDLRHDQVNETRDAASSWLERNAAPGDRVGYFGVPGKLPALSSRIVSELAAPRVGEGDSRLRGEQALADLAASGPDYLLIVPDWTSAAGAERSGDCPVEVWEALLEGTLPYRLAAQFSTRSPLPSWLRRPPLDSPAVAPPVRIYARQTESGDG